MGRTLLEALGSALDLPGSSIRDVLSLRNPVDQWLTPFSQENRTSGQEMLGRWGLGDDHDLGGFAAEILTDPASLLGGGMALKGLRGLNVLGKGSKIGKATTLAKALFKSPEATSTAWRDLTGVAARDAAEAAAKRQAGSAANMSFGPAASQAVDANQAAAALFPDQLAAQSPWAGRVSRAGKLLSNPNAQRTAKGLGLVQLLTMGRDSRNELDPYAQQYEGMMQ